MGRIARHARTARAQDQVRYHICAEAARIMAEEGVRDYQTVKRKAAARLGHPETRDLPSNREIETALRQYLELFHGARRTQTLKSLRALALEAMRFLAAFDPRLAGAVLSGTVTPYSGIELHVAADSPEQIALLLHEHHIPCDQHERRLRFGGDRQLSVPTFSFRADDTVVEICVFGHEAMREPPLSPVDGKPMQRAGRAEVERLLA